MIGVQTGPRDEGPRSPPMTTWGPRLGCWWWRRLRRSVAPFFTDQPIKTICRELKLSRKVVRKVIRSEATEFRYGERAADAEDGRLA